MGTAKTCFSTRTNKARVMACVIGSRIVNTVPSPTAEAIEMFPLSLRILSRTMSMPTPRPETSVSSFAVEKPGSNNKLMAGFLVEGIGLFRGEHSQFHGFRANLRRVDAPAVVGDFQNHLRSLAETRGSKSLASSGLPCSARSSGDSIP